MEKTVCPVENAQLGGAHPVFFVPVADGDADGSVNQGGADTLVIEGIDVERGAVCPDAQAVGDDVKRLVRHFLYFKEGFAGEIDFSRLAGECHGVF